MHVVLLPQFLLSLFLAVFVYEIVCPVDFPQSDLVDYIPVVSFSMPRYPLYFLKVGS